jgi:mRNA deadenylase 3'-5' endonuclease subunit Ccr4
MNPLTIEYIGGNVPTRMKKYPKKIHNLSMITFNIFGIDEPYSKLDTRLPYIGDEIVKHNVDIICLQNISNRALEYFKKRKKLTDNYYFIQSKINMLILTKYKPQNIEQYIIDKQNSFITIKYPSILIINTFFNDLSHFDQLKPFIENNNYIISGSFNDDLNNLNNSNDMNDMWKILKPNDNGYTIDTTENKMRWNITQKRLQIRESGILYNNLKPKNIELIGLQSIFTILEDDKDFNNYIKNNKLDERFIKTTNEKIHYWLSDRFGIIARFN